ncbi:hypothetical protein Smp_169600 [Schistosoma mansoni]|uniref:hypothetical protein n=1 Tax=Schistosoma mansoni TaxID=6183 RepID=UPI00019B38C9|nr:hypothetical protein Smp_169600 [Schistosoma mansoni]|eukprot:XP_018652176.1 hypothetical protein Smp_169600 [Schistosoma mansoni]
MLEESNKIKLPLAYVSFLRNLSRFLANCVHLTFDWHNALPFLPDNRSDISDHGVKFKGDGCKDCCQLCFCNGCIACQMHYEAQQIGVIEKKTCSDACNHCCVCYR